jgi:hypothetical protein
MERPTRPIYDLWRPHPSPLWPFAEVSSVLQDTVPEGDSLTFPKVNSFHRLAFHCGLSPSGNCSLIDDPLQSFAYWSRHDSRLPHPRQQIHKSLDLSSSGTSSITAGPPSTCSQARSSILSIMLISELVIGRKPAGLCILVMVGSLPSKELWNISNEILEKDSPQEFKRI